MNRTIFQEIYQMKKLLQASTAIIGVAMIASSAHAGLEISGTGILGISLGSGEGKSDTMQFDQVGYYIGFSGSKKTDSGLTLSGGAFLDDSKAFNTEEDDIPAVWDKTNFAIAGGFGKVEVSNKGDASNLSGYSGYIAPGAGGLDGYGQLVPMGYYKTNMEIPRGLTRINYYSPNINGFSAGFSMMESGGDSEYNGKKENGPFEGRISSALQSLQAPAQRANPITTAFDALADGATAAQITAARETDATAQTAELARLDALDAPLITANAVVANAIVAGTATTSNPDGTGYSDLVTEAREKAAGGHQSAIAIGVKYVSTFGLTFGYGTTTYSQSKTLKGITANVSTLSDDAAANAIINSGIANDVNGEYSNGWTGTRLNLGYSAGPFSVGYTSTVKEFAVAKIAGVEQKDARKTEAQKANLDNVNTTIGLSYNYGAGTVGLNTESEDYAGKGDKAETTTVTVIGVIHTITPGVRAYLNQISGEGNYDVSKEGLESASELVIGLNVSF